MSDLIDRGALAEDIKELTAMSEPGNPMKAWVTQEAVLNCLERAPTISCEECEHEGWCEQSVTMYDPGRRKQAGMMARETRMGLDACSRFQRRQP